MAQEVLDEGARVEACSLVEPPAAEHGHHEVALVRDGYLGWASSMALSRVVPDRP